MKITKRLGLAAVLAAAAIGTGTAVAGPAVAAPATPGSVVPPPGGGDPKWSLGATYGYEWQCQVAGAWDVNELNKVYDTYECDDFNGVWYLFLHHV